MEQFVVPHSFTPQGSHTTQGTSQRANPGDTSQSQRRATPSWIVCRVQECPVPPQRIWRSKLEHSPLTTWIENKRNLLSSLQAMTLRSRNRTDGYLLPMVSIYCPCCLFRALRVALWVPLPYSQAWVVWTMLGMAIPS